MLQFSSTLLCKCAQALFISSQTLCGLSYHSDLQVHSALVRLMQHFHVNTTVDAHKHCHSLFHRMAICG